MDEKYCPHNFCCTHKNEGTDTVLLIAVCEWCDEEFIGLMSRPPFQTLRKRIAKKEIDEGPD